MNLLDQKITLRRILGMIAGVVIIGIGIAVFKFSRLGNDSISALNLRLAELVGLPFSIENVLMNLCLFVPQLLWGRRYIGLGTIINSFCIGFIVTFTGDAMTAVFGSADTLPVQLLWVAVAVLVIALGCSLYQTADLGVAPYDALSLMLADRLPVPYFGCRVFTDALCAVLAFLLGGLIGLGTLICAFVGFHLDRTSTWGYSKLFYAPDSTAKAARLFTSVADQYKGNNNFEYDLVDIVRQSNADKGNVLLEEISQSYDRKDKEDFRKQTQQFLDLILAQDRLLSTRKEFSVSSWLNAARSLGTTEEEKRLYEWNASALITVWGDSIAANQGGLHDYSHREWSGLLKDLYYQRWKAFFEQKQAELDGKPAGQEINFYGMEKAWAEKSKAQTLKN